MYNVYIVGFVVLLAIQNVLSRRFSATTSYIYIHEYCIYISICKYNDLGYTIHTHTTISV